MLCVFSKSSATQKQLNRMIQYKSKLPEITLKYKSTPYIQKAKVSSSQDLFDMMKNMFNEDTVEYCEESIIMFLNGANKSIGWMRHTTGGTSQTVIDIKMILVSALQCGASAMAVAHNHPSGQLSPSREDIKITERIKQGCEAIGVRFLDHLIITPEYVSYYSFCDEGKI